MPCTICGGFSAKENLKGVLLCGRHSREGVTAPYCKSCGHVMTVKKGKFGSFWGCTFYPNCMATATVG